jgi:hypothetical protein
MWNIIAIQFDYTPSLQKKKVNFNNACLQS